MMRSANPGACCSIRACIRSANRSSSPASQEPVSSPPASECTFCGTCVYAHRDSVPAGERIGSAVVIWPINRNGLSGMAPAFNWP